MVPNDSPDVSAPPPGLSKENFAAVQAARHLCDPSTIVVGNAVDLEILSLLLAAYDALAARLSWLAAQHAEVMDR